MWEIFQYEFVLRAFMAGIIISVLAPSIGAFVVVRQYSLISDTLSHGAFLGVALASLLKINPVLMAMIVTILAAFGIDILRRRKKVYSDAALAIFLWGSLSSALVILNFSSGSNAAVVNFLFGSIAAISVTDFYLILGVSAVSLVVVKFFYKEFLSVAFDEDLASAAGLKVGFINILMMLLTAITVAAAIRVVGLLLIGGLMVLPVISALQIAKSFKSMLFLAIGISLISMIVGLTISYFGDLASGATVVLTTIVFFIFSMVVKSWR